MIESLRKRSGCCKKGILKTTEQKNSQNFKISSFKTMNIKPRLRNFPGIRIRYTKVKNI